ncbi:MAG TPA: flagellar filament capping protein FliD [Polyangia bacterium]|nr:flagellar filament capping protein FliD [Polyangia bacterium]
MADDPVFRAGGLASGLDTNSIIDGLTKLESRPLDMLRTQQTGFKTQVSLIGSLVSKIGTLYSAAKALSDNGALGVKTTSTNTDFSATATANASSGSYTVSVQELATSAQKRTAAFGASTAAVRGGTLEVKVQGQSYGTITMTDGEQLSDVANDIKGLGAPVNISILSNGSGSTYLSITNKNTGFTTPDKTTALELIETTDPLATKGQTLGFSVAHDATNAQFTVDHLAFTRQSNTVTDAIPGASLQLKAKSNTDEQLTMDYDTAATATNLQKFVDAYNDIITTVHTAQTVPAGTDRGATLAGDSTVRGLIGSLQGVITSTVSGLGNVRTMADLGLKTNFQDGTISVDSTKLATAISLDASAVNKVFSDSLTGVSAQAFNLSQKYTGVIDGVLTSRKKGLNDAIKRMDGDADKLQARIDAFKNNLVIQFSAMEQLVGGLKATGNFLTQQQAQPK